MEDSEERQHQSQADIYKRIKLLGSGSYGRAYLVQEKLTGKEWVIKQINLADMTQVEQEAALKQAKILEMLDHQNIVQFREVYRTAKMKLNIVMEYAGGGDLSHRIKTAKEGKIHFSECQILNWFVQVCLAVRYIHSNKIIHRDLKAQNVFLTEDGLVKLGDFGVAKVLEHTAAKARTVVGSPYYLSPQIIENRPYTLKTDIWSLGALLYELCALQPPFKGNNLQFLALKIVQGSPPPLPKMYSEELRSLVRWMLQIKESNRPSINQILSSRIIIDTIRKLKQASEVVQKPISQTVSDFKKMSTLKPPPNLLDFDPNQNKSDVVMNKRVDQVNNQPIKAQTPQVNVRKGANNFFNNRPMTGRKKTALMGDMDLADLMHIKPSVIEKHEKYQKPLVPLPPVPQKLSPVNKVVSPSNNPSTIELNKVERKHSVAPSSAVFSKKRTSFAQGEVDRKEGQKVDDLKVGKGMNKKSGAQSKKGSKKPQIRKKTFVAAKKESSEIKLEVCSQQAKKVQAIEKKMEKKRSQKILKKVQKKKEKKMSSVLVRQDDQSHTMMEQQKCNEQLTSNNESDDYFSSYYDEDFQDYSEESDDELTFSVTANDNFNFQKMMVELQKIQKIVEAGQDIQEDQSLQKSIPELINFSAQIREDDNQLDSNHSSKVVDYEPEVQKIDYCCLDTPQSLQVLRMKLEDIFGDQDLIYAYQAIESKLGKVGLNFCEQQIMGEILEQRKEIRKQVLSKYFGHIVAIISRQNKVL